VIDLADLDRRPTTLRFAPGNHVYRDVNKHMPGVTTVIKWSEDQQGLIAWNGRKAAERAVEQPEEWNRRLRLDGQEAAVKWIAQAGNDDRDAKGLKGSDLHDVAFRMSLGEMPQFLYPDIKWMAEQVLLFWDEFDVTPMMSEVRLANRTVGYCGTTDSQAIVPKYGELPVIIDYKTAEKAYIKPDRYWGSHAMQLAAYSHAEVMFWDADDDAGLPGLEADMLPLNQNIGLILHVRPEGYKLCDHKLVTAWPQFQRALANWRWWKTVDKISRGPVVPPRFLDEMLDVALTTTSMDELLAYCQRARDLGVWNDEWRHLFRTRRILIESRSAATG
jgi:hypothetical protein